MPQPFFGAVEYSSRRTRGAEGSCRQSLMYADTGIPDRMTDEKAKSGRTGIAPAYTEDIFSRETMDYIMHCLLGDNTIY